MNETKTEYKVIIVLLIITACQVLGIDVSSIIAMFQQPEVKDLLGIVKDAHNGSNWLAILAAWGGAGVYTTARTNRKNTITRAQEKKPTDISLDEATKDMVDSILKMSVKKQ